MKTAEELGIEPWEHKRLIEVRALLMQDSFDVKKPVNTRCSKPVFDMGISALGTKEAEKEGYACPSVSCIGGSMYLLEHGVFGENLSNDDAKLVDGYVWRNRPLHILFFPPSHVPYDKITPSIAAEAIENFLNTGDPKWEELNLIEMEDF